MSRLQEQTNDPKKGWMNKKKKLERGELGLCVHSQHEGDNDKTNYFSHLQEKCKWKQKQERFHKN